MTQSSLSIRRQRWSDLEICVAMTHTVAVYQTGGEAADCQTESKRERGICFVYSLRGWSAASQMNVLKQVR